MWSSKDCSDNGNGPTLMFLPVTIEPIFAVGDDLRRQSPGGGFVFFRQQILRHLGHFAAASFSSYVIYTVYFPGACSEAHGRVIESCVAVFCESLACGGSVAPAGKQATG